MTTESVKDRSATFLIDNHIPYSEMTDAEINSVIEWKAARKAESEEIKQRQAAFERTQQEIISKLELEKSKAQTDFEEIIGRVAARALAVEEQMREYD